MFFSCTPHLLNSCFKLNPKQFIISIINILHKIKTFTNAEIPSEPFSKLFCHASFQNSKIQSERASYRYFKAFLQNPS